MNRTFPASLRFLGALILLWVAGRATFLIGPAWLFPSAEADVPAMASMSRLTRERAALPHPVHTPSPPSDARPARIRSVPTQASLPPARFDGTAHIVGEGSPALPVPQVADIAAAPAPTPPSEGGVAAETAYEALRQGDRRQADAAFSRALALADNDPRAAAWRTDKAWLNRRWSGAAYALVGRGDGDLGLGSRPQLSGSQMGARLAYRPDPLSNAPLDLVVRTYAPLHKGGAASHAAQSAVGVEWRPDIRIPASIAVERYVAFGDRARDAFAVRVGGGVYERPVVGPVRFSAYGEAGMVGLARRDLFFDGSARAALALPTNGIIVVKPAVAVWGGAQPGARRFDLGPPVSAGARPGTMVLAADIDWRLRTAGNARPASGPALTVRAGF